MQSVKRLGSLAASNRQIPPVTKGGSGTLLTPAWSGQRRKRQEEGYEQLIVSAARVIVDPATTEEKRAKAQESLLNACARVSAFHGLSASRLYWGAIRRAEEHGGREG
jgi:hypothetical protein